MSIPGRAITDDEKRAIIERLYNAWILIPDLRLGQLIENARCFPGGPGGGPDLFYLEDQGLATAVEFFLLKTGSSAP